ncbi:hypothetical protein GLOIN_2v1830060 [Rhizophagus irregularis DAOM 181602=DAOM 197198]|nr:hypothetical protein GLOIN_2v1830060 [Rhizophagus irregularis DAOM 181602=DAOM 197198]
MARMTKVLYQEGNFPKLNAADFVKLIENHDPNLQGFFDTLYNAMNPKGKNKRTQECLKQKIMLLCYQMAGLRNKQVSGAKTAVGLFFVKSGASAHCVNTAANMGLYDYHNLHGTCIPSVNSTSQISHMATILFNTTQAPPIPYYTDYHLAIHNPCGVDASILRNVCQEFMLTLAKSYNSEKSSWNWASDLVVVDETEIIERLTIHSYDSDISEKYQRKFNQTKLVDCIELDLKNTKNYIQAANTFLRLPETKEYLKMFVIPFPADFPGQLFIRRAVTKRLKMEAGTEPEPELESSIPKEIMHLVPFLGPLHVSLNTRESVMIIFHSFFDYMYKIVFNKKQKLAAKPKPWRINLLLYLAHEGRLLIKNCVLKRFAMSKDISYVTFLDLLDNLVPSTLDIYSNLFRSNYLEEYISTIFRLWTIMRRFQWHNYDKIMLAFLSDIHYWKKINHPIIHTLKTHLNTFDEYPVENYHSILRRHTNAKVSTGKSLRRDALFLDHCRHENLFVKSFEPTRDYPYTKKDLDNLVKLTAIFHLDFFDNLWKNPGRTELKKEGKKIKKDFYYFPGIKSQFSSKALPLGYHSKKWPSANKLCDRLECTDPSWIDGMVLNCGHGYHETCFRTLGLKCPHCFKYLSDSIDELSQSYNQRLQMDEDIKKWADCESENHES